MSRNKYAAESRRARAAVRRLFACDRKRAYETEAAAMQPGQMHYQCRYCGKWHRSGSAVRQAKIAAAIQGRQRDRKAKHRRRRDDADRHK